MSLLTCIVVADHAAVGTLVERARALGEVVAVVAGSATAAEGVATAGVDRVGHIPLPEGTPVEALAGAVAAAVADIAPDVLLASTRPADRVLLAAAAVARAAPTYPFVVSVTGTDGGVTVERDRYGGLSRETITTAGPVALVLDGGRPVNTEPPAPIEVRPAEGVLPMRIEEVRPRSGVAVDLGIARRIVAVGRGLQALEDLPLVQELADALHAELGCSRPLAEGLNWLAKDRYIGVSGAHVGPDLYVAVGISGQLQHTSGARSAKTIVVINRDPEAPYAQECDYFCQGDLYAIVPALTAALR